MVAIDAGGGLVPLNPATGGVVVAVIAPNFIIGHGTTVEQNDTLRIYQSTKQFQITGSGFRNDTKVRVSVSCCRFYCSSLASGATS